MAVATRRTTASRSSRPGVYRQPARVQYYNRRRKARPGTSLRDLAGTDTFTFSITDSAVVLPFTVIAKAGTDTFTYSITDSAVVAVTQVKLGADTFTFSITDTAVRQTLGPVTGTRMSPAKPLSGQPIISSLITWVEKYIPPGGSILVETSINNGLTWDVARSGWPIPRLEPGSTSARAVLTRTTITRVDANDPTPRVSDIWIDADENDSVVEWIPLGVFDFEDADISDDENGIEISLSGLDISGKIAAYGWESIFVQPAGKNLGDVIKAVISNRYPAAVFNFASTDAVAPRTLTFGARDENNPWQDCLDIAAYCGMELYVDAYGTFTMRPEPDPEVGDPVWTYTDRANTVMTKIRRRLTKSQTKNYIVVTGESTANTTPARGVAYDDDPTSASYWLGRLGTRVLRITSKLIGDDNAAVVMARAQLLKRKNLTETVSIEAITNAAQQESDIIKVERSVSKLAGNFLVDRMQIPMDVESNMTMEARRQRLAGSTPIGGGVGGLNDDDNTGGSSDPQTTAFRVAFTSCCNAGDSSAYTDIKNANPDYFFHLGDVWYDDGGSNHVSHWNAQMGASNFAALIASLPNPPLIGWSDHDFGFANNSVGVGNSITATANAAYRSKFPDIALPANGIYRTWTRGRIRFVYLDCLTFKSPLGTASSTSRTMLGSTQKSWFKGLLADTAFPVIVCIGDGQWGGPAEDGQDEWRGYAAERSELQSAFNASPATTIYLEGDTHSLAIGRSKFGIDRIWRASPIYNNTKVKAGGADYDETYPLNADEDTVGFHKHYGIIEFTDDNESISVTFRGYGDGSLQMTDTVNVSAPGGTGGGGTAPPAASVGALLKIGSTAGYNKFNVGIGNSGGSHVDHDMAQIEGGYNQAGYFELAAGGTRAKLSSPLDGGTTPGSNYPRTEFRELALDGVTKAAWNPDSGTHYCKIKTRVTKMPPNKPQLVLLQAHDQDDDVAMVYMSSKTTVQAKLGDTVVGTLTSGLTFGTDYVMMIKVVGSGSTSVVSWYWGTTDADLVTPAFSSSAAARSDNWYFKAGTYSQSNSSTDNVSDGPFITEPTKIECWHTGYPAALGWT